MRILLTPLVLIGIVCLWLSINGIIFPIIAIISFAMVAIIDNKFPKEYHFNYLSDKIPFGKHIGKTIKQVIESDYDYATWLITRKNVFISHEVEKAHAEWAYLAH